jgi:hypothetical protein
MLPSKRGADDLPRFSTDSLISGLPVLPFSSCFLCLYLSTHGCLVSCFLTCRLFWDNQGFWSELSDEAASKLSRSVVSIALTHGDLVGQNVLFASSGIAIECQPNFTKFVTSAILVRALNYERNGHDNIKVGAESFTNCSFLLYITVIILCCFLALLL